MIKLLPWSLLALCSFVAPISAQSNGMDMSMDGPMNLAAGNMLPYLHFTPGDVVWLFGWVPSSVGAMVGTCIGLFLLSILERWLAACLELAEQHWVERANVLVVEKSEGITKRLFVPEFDIMRGVLFAAQKSVQVLLMLTVMTFQAAFILSISIGSGVGETLYGRFLLSAHEH